MGENVVLTYRNINNLYDHFGPSISKNILAQDEGQEKDHKQRY